MTSFADDSEEATTADAELLKRFKVQKVLTKEELQRLHVGRLARLAGNGVDQRLWRRLERCNGSGCPYKLCSAACMFGERREINRLVRQSRSLLKRASQPRYFVTVIDPNYFVPAGALATVSVDGIFQSLRRRIAKAPENWKAARMVGAIDISYNREADGREFWTPHVHLTVAVDADKTEIRKVFKPLRDPPLGFVGKRFRAVKVKPVTNLANAIAYSSKSTVDGRRAILDGRENVDRAGFKVSDSVQLEHDLWLLGMKPRDRAFLSGMMASRGGVVVRERR